MEHIQNARTKKRKLIYISSLQGLLYNSQSFRQAILYLDLGFFFYFLHPCKESNVSCFDDTVNFTIVQKVMASRVCIFSSCGRVLWKELFFFFVILKAFLWPAKSERETKMCTCDLTGFSTLPPFVRCCLTGLIHNFSPRKT